MRGAWFRHGPPGERMTQGVGEDVRRHHHRCWPSRPHPWQLSRQGGIEHPSGRAPPGLWRRSCHQRSDRAGFYHNLHSINHFHISETPWFKDLGLEERVTYITPRYEFGQAHSDGSALVFGARPRGDHRQYRAFFPARRQKPSATGTGAPRKLPRASLDTRALRRAVAASRARSAIWQRRR